MSRRVGLYPEACDMDNLDLEGVVFVKSALERCEFLPTKVYPMSCSKRTAANLGLRRIYSSVS
jgi:hypothetical protein